MQRIVTRCTRDADGDTLLLCNPVQSWGPRGASQVISDIESGVYVYYTERAGARARIYVKTRGYKKYLTTSADGTTLNNLDYLPPC